MTCCPIPARLRLMPQRRRRTPNPSPSPQDQAEAAALDRPGPADAPKVKRKKEKPIGTEKAVETMFRNSYRAELDTIALAAMKANIMISLNGFIISALMISGAFIFASSPAFLFPAGVFLVTAAVSIVFALLSASPERSDLFTGLRDWASAVRRREARLRDLRAYMTRPSAARRPPARPTSSSTSTACACRPRPIGPRCRT